MYLFFSAEAAAEDALVQRLKKCGADLNRVRIVSDRFTLDEKGIIHLRAAVAEHEAALVIIDPLFAYADAKVDRRPR